MNPALLAAIATTVGGVFGKVLLSLLTTLLTETVLKRVIILLLEKVSSKTANDLDNQLLAIAKEAWEQPKP
jgi:uncharacterized membrane protein